MLEPSLCIVLHEVAPATWARCRRILDILATIDDFQVTLLAVPHYHGQARNSGFERWLRHRADRGDEIALHGYSHLGNAPARNWTGWLSGRSQTRSNGEFARLTFDEANIRLQSGLDWLRELGLAPAGFVAPAGLLGAQAWRAVRQHPFEYTCTSRRVYLLPEQRAIRCQGQVYSASSPWRRMVSVVWNESLSWLQRRQALIRLELHPGDLHPSLRRSWQWLAYQQTRNRRVCTLRDLTRDLRATPEATEPMALE